MQRSFKLLERLPCCSGFAQVCVIKAGVFNLSAAAKIYPYAVTGIIHFHRIIPAGRIIRPDGRRIPVLLRKLLQENRHRGAAIHRQQAALLVKGGGIIIVYHRAQIFFHRRGSIGYGAQEVITHHIVNPFPFQLGVVVTRLG